MNYVNILHLISQNILFVEHLKALGIYIGVINGGRWGSPSSFITWGGPSISGPPVFHLRLSSIDCFFFSKFEFSIFDMFNQVLLKLFTFLKNAFSRFLILQYYRINWTNNHTDREACN